MKAQILQVDSAVHKTTGEIKYAMTVLADFLSFGIVRPGTCQVQLTPETYEKYKPLEMKVADLDVVMPLPDYPLRLK